MGFTRPPSQTPLSYAWCMPVPSDTASLSHFYEALRDNLVTLGALATEDACALILLHCGTREDAGLTRLLDAVKLHTDQHLVKLYTTGLACDFMNFPFYANTALRLGAQHGYDFLEILAPLDYLPSSPMLLKLEGMMDEHNTSVLALFQNGGAWGGRIATWAWCWDAMGYFEQTLTDLHLEALVWRFHWEHDIEVAQTELGLAGLRVVSPGGSGSASSSNLPATREKPAQDFNFSGWEVSWEEERRQKEKKKNNATIPFVGAPTYRAFADGAVADFACPDAVWCREEDPHL